MFLLGINTVGGTSANEIMPTNVENINYISIIGAWYDDLYVTKNPEFEMGFDIPFEWDYDTILYAPFNGTTHAGNILVGVDEVSHLLIKRRLPGTFLWQTIYVREINTIDDFKLVCDDYYVPAGAEIEYAIVPVYYGLEQEYNTIKVTQEFNWMFLISGDGTVYGTNITDGFCDTTRNIPSSNVELLNYKYPIFVRNSQANYDTGECKGCFIQIHTDDGECSEEQLSPQYDYARVKYQKEVMDFISNGEPKVLKLPDGRMWIVQVTPNPTDTADNVYYYRQISFSWVEIGDAFSEEDMYYLGLSSIDQSWWNK